MTETFTAVADGGSVDESVESFRLRARAWLAANMPRSEAGVEEEGNLSADDEDWLRARELQKILYSGGFAGICYPREYGGQGLSRAHQLAFNEESVGYRMPLLLNVPTLSICGPTILDMGTEEQKLEHLPKVIAGEEVLVQFLSESRGGSDLAGVTTRATRDGDVFVLNGEKIWSSGAYAGDYALCLTRTDWEAPKHRGMTMLLVKIHQPGIEIRRIRQTNGSDEFCEEFFDDVEIPAANVVGEVGGGWAVASQQLFHERNAVGGGSPYVSGPQALGRRVNEAAKLIGQARAAGISSDARVRENIAEHHVLTTVQEHLVARISKGMVGGHLPSSSGAVIRLFSGEAEVRRAELALEIAGPGALADTASAPNGKQVGEAYIFRQFACLGGGSVEISRNVISERILGMPREYAADRDVPFSQVRQGR